MDLKLKNIYKKSSCFFQKDIEKSEFGGMIVEHQNNPIRIPGYEKKSFLLYYNGGEIWFEHLDGIYEHEELVLKKLLSDIPFFTKPSATSFVCFVFDETIVTDSILNAVFEAVFETKKIFQKIAFCGLDKARRKKFKKTFCNKGISIGFFDGLEDAKMWLLP